MIFVTGGTGLVGSHILLKLAQEEKDFIALKRNSSSLAICQKIFKYYDASRLFKKIKWIDGDINNIPSLEEGMKSCEFVIHTAGLVSFRRSEANLLRKVNIEGTKNVMNVALMCGVKKLAYVSSIAALGPAKENQIITEELYLKQKPSESNYSISKYYAEQEVWRASAEGLDVVIVNPSIILGAGDWDKGSSQIFQKIYNGLNFYTLGSTGYVDVDDVAACLIKLLFSEIKNERFILNGANLKYRICFDKIAKIMGKDKARIKVTPLIKEIAWRIEAIRAFFTGKKPLLTKETANSSMTVKAFSSLKIEKSINFQFTDIDLTIKKYTEWFISELKNPFL